MAIKDKEASKAMFDIGLKLQGIALMSTDAQFEKIKPYLSKIEEDVLVLVNHIEKLEGGSES